MFEICLIKALITERGREKKSKSWHKHEPKNLLTETKSTSIKVNLFTEAQERTSTSHSSQLTPIYPRAFKNGPENRESETESLQHRLLVRIKGIPWVGGKRLQTPHNAAQPNEIMQIKL